MGEMADYMINGDDCQECGMYIGPGDGYPRTCGACRRDRKREAALPKADASGRVACPTCGKRVKAVGLWQHARDAHSHSIGSAEGK